MGWEVWVWLSMVMYGYRCVALLKQIFKIIVLYVNNILKYSVCDNIYS